MARITYKTNDASFALCGSGESTDTISIWMKSKYAYRKFLELAKMALPGRAINSIQFLFILEIIECRYIGEEFPALSVDAIFGEDLNKIFQVHHLELSQDPASTEPPSIIIVLTRQDFPDQNTDMNKQHKQESTAGEGVFTDQFNNYNEAKNAQRIEETKKQLTDAADIYLEKIEKTSKSARNLYADIIEQARYIDSKIGEFREQAQKIESIVNKDIAMNDDVLDYVDKRVKYAVLEIKEYYNGFGDGKTEAAPQRPYEFANQQLHLLDETAIATLIKNKELSVYFQDNGGHSVYVPLKDEYKDNKPLFVECHGSFFIMAEYYEPCKQIKHVFLGKPADVNWVSAELDEYDYLKKCESNEENCLLPILFAPPNEILHAFKEDFPAMAKTIFGEKQEGGCHCECSKKEEPKKKPAIAKKPPVKRNDAKSNSDNKDNNTKPSKK